MKQHWYGMRYEVQLNEGVSARKTTERRKMQHYLSDGPYHDGVPSSDDVTEKSLELSLNKISIKTMKSSIKSVIDSKVPPVIYTINT